MTPRIHRGLARLVRVVLLAVALVASLPRLAQASPAGQTAPDMLTISSAPLRIVVGANTRLQVFHDNYQLGAAFGEAGSGFFLSVDGSTYGPNFLAYTPVSHDGPSGSGRASDPYQIVTAARVEADGLALLIEQTVSYVEGQDYFLLDWRIANESRSRVCFKAYHAADLYFADSDFGSGYFNEQSGSVGGSNQAGDWFMVFSPRTPADHYEEALYTTIWSRVGSGVDLQDTISEAYLDNGAALQWDRCLNRAQSVNLGDAWSFGESEIEVMRPASEGGFAPVVSASSPSYRAPGPLTPALTTYIPTPLDISLAPAVVGSNLLLAALAMIAFIAGSEMLNRTLAENEVFFQKLFLPVRWLRERLQQASAAMNRVRGLDWVKLAVILLLYGFIFSLLDASWQPFSLAGVNLFLAMTFAYGLAGLADDLAQWLAARRWKVGGGLGVRPGNLLLALASAGFSRLFGLTPGIMFGSPEAFDADAAANETRVQNRLLRVAALTLLALSLLFWLPTLFTALLRRLGLPEILQTLIGGAESFMLVVFAVTVQNIFLQMLAFRGSFGEALRRWNLFAWAGGLLAATYLLLQTLLNPNGDVGKALGLTNIRFFLLTIGLFLLSAFLVWLGFKLYRRAQVWEVERKMAALPGPDGVVRPHPVRSIPVWVLAAAGLTLLLCVCLAVVAVVLLARQFG